ncbi:MAG: hypothetical protein JWQ29_2172 [Phenylobacterium sp.]|nr:hypothetical protein [Phenylobacterium sp.]
MPFQNHPPSSGRLKADPRDDKLGARGEGTLAPTLATAAFLALVPVAALAHEGHHDGMSFAQAARHMLTQPDHLAMLALAVLLIGYGGWRLYRAS